MEKFLKMEKLISVTVLDLAILSKFIGTYLKIKIGFLASFISYIILVCHPDLTQFTSKHQRDAPPSQPLR